MKFLFDMFTKRNVVFSLCVTAAVHIFFYIPWWIPVQPEDYGGGLDLFWYWK